MDALTDLIRRLLDEKLLISMVFSDSRKKSLPYNKVVLRPFVEKEDLRYQFEYHEEKKVLHKNLDRAACYSTIIALLSEDFKKANIFSIEADYQILAAKIQQPKIIKKSPSKTAPILSHNQAKHYIIPDGTPCDFLIRLGVMSQTGQVYKSHYAKFRQINKFLEIVADSLVHFPTNRDLQVIDFGCGKAYLTFALYHYLHIIKEKQVQIVGLDLKADVIDFCNRVSQDLGYANLIFKIGDIADYKAEQGTDMVVTLHACDTATDYALINAVAWDASVILSVPCCQHELFSQLNNKINEPLLKHGLLKERFTGILTDTLRGLKLEEKGYEVSMVEFTSLEHTAKNIMIKAIKTGKSNGKAKEDFDNLVAFWQVNPTIGQLT